MSIHRPFAFYPLPNVFDFPQKSIEVIFIRIKKFNYFKINPSSKKNLKNFLLFFYLACISCLKKSTIYFLKCI